MAFFVFFSLRSSLLHSLHSFTDSFLFSIFVFACLLSRLWGVKGGARMLLEKQCIFSSKHFLLLFLLLPFVKSLLQYCIAGCANFFTLTDLYFSSLIKPELGKL